MHVTKTTMNVSRSNRAWRQLWCDDLWRVPLLFTSCFVGVILFIIGVTFLCTQCHHTATAQVDSVRRVDFQFCEANVTYLGDRHAQLRLSCQPPGTNDTTVEVCYSQLDAGDVQLRYPASGDSSYTAWSAVLALLIVGGLLVAIPALLLAGTRLAL